MPHAYPFRQPGHLIRKDEQQHPQSSPQPLQAGRGPPYVQRMARSAQELLAVKVTGLTKRFGPRTVVDHLDLEIPAGSVCGFVGPNGAGKTTTIRMLLGLILPNAGSGTILGGDLRHPETYLHRVGALIESPAFYPSLSGRDNLLALARLGGIPRTWSTPCSPGWDCSTGHWTRTGPTRWA